MLVLPRKWLISSSKVEGRPIPPSVVNPTKEQAVIMDKNEIHRHVATAVAAARFGRGPQLAEFSSVLEKRGILLDNPPAIGAVGEMIDVLAVANDGSEFHIRLVAVEGRTAERDRDGDWNYHSWREWTPTVHVQIGR